MSDVAIQVENLSKRYRIDQESDASYNTLRESLTKAVQAPIRWMRHGASWKKREKHYIWALENLCFEIMKGEVVGIIGRNGAGKSTLLKVLSRITEPTTGTIKIYGRVGSLLEVGTGFHPELSGRENITLNGAILGMRKAEIDKKFDEIVAFAELEKFIDTPVKFYSSGMYVRLAFAVAAHMEPEILVVDEVLAVGDAAFQKKCLGKMGEVAKQGRTVLFVSHNMSSIQGLCSKAFLIDAGRITGSGPVEKMIADYLESSSLHSNKPLEFNLSDDRFDLKNIEIGQNESTNNALLNLEDDVRIKVSYRLKTTIRRLKLGFDLFSSDGSHLFRTFDLVTYGLGEREPGEYVSTLTLPASYFKYGAYYLDLRIGVHREGWISKDEIRIKIRFEGPEKGGGEVEFPGILPPQGSWLIERIGQKIEAIP